MHHPIGFALITHGNSDQVLFLCEQLNRQFDRPPIAIHHDFSKENIGLGSFPSNVIFVNDWVRTKWGGWGIVEGEMRALRLLYRKHDPDWFVILSGTDFPTKSAATILDDLYCGEFDAYLDYRKIGYCRLPIPPEGFGERNYHDPAWVTLAFERYMALGIGYYKLATRMGWNKKAFYLRQNSIIRKLTPFDGTLDCYAGDFWLTGNRETAMSLLDNEKNARLIRHLRRRPVPDEAFNQSVLCNDSRLKISPDSKRFADWRGCTNHPNLLGKERFEELRNSSCHFARKFVFDPSSLGPFGDSLASPHHWELRLHRTG